MLSVPQKRGRNSGNACRHSVQNLLSSRLLSGSVRTAVYRTIILSSVLCGCETWSITLRCVRTVRVFANKVQLGRYVAQEVGSSRRLESI